MEDEKRKALFLNQKQTLDTFLGNGAITQAQYDKSFYEAEEYHQDYYLKNPEAFEKELRESGRRRDE